MNFYVCVCERERDKRMINGGFVAPPLPLHREMNRLRLKFHRVRETGTRV